MATMMLRIRLRQRSHEFAVNEVRRKFNKERTVIEEAWAAHKNDAFLSLWRDRARKNKSWTGQEIDRLEKILKMSI